MEARGKMVAMVMMERPRRRRVVPQEEEGKVTGIRFELQRSGEIKSQCGVPASHLHTFTTSIDTDRVDRCGWYRATE